MKYFLLIRPEIVRYPSPFKSSLSRLTMLHAWLEQAKKFKAGEITKEEYDQWRYNYPKFDAYQRWAKVPSQELSDYLVKSLNSEEEK